MKKMGFGKKSDGDEDPNRSGLFGRKKAPVDDNPYAQQPAEDPYARKTPYQQARAGLPGGPRPGGGGGLPSGPGPRASGGPPPPYSNSPQPSVGSGGGGGYGSDKLGATGGYGTNRYDNSNAPAYGSGPRQSPAPSRGPTRGPGGYGGLGRTDTSATDDNRDALFSGAQSRYQQASNDRYGQGQSGTAGGSYDGYGAQRELTEEEQEQEDVRNMSNQIRDVRQESVRTLDRSLAMADQAIETSLGTYARLGAQSERLYNTEKNLDLAANQSRIAGEKASELKTLNRSMFAVHVSNPFTSGKRAAQRDQDVLDKHREERDRRQATRQDAFAASQRMESSFRDITRQQPQGLLGMPKTSAAERSKHLFVDDDEDPELAEQDERDEEAIDNKLSELHGRVGMLNTIGRRMGEEVDSQIGHIDRIAAKVSNLPLPVKHFIFQRTVLLTVLLHTERCCRRRSEDEPGAAQPHSLGLNFLLLEYGIWNNHHDCIHYQQKMTWPC